jgi:tetratricopeptide (TPR) repeat protein
MAILFCLVAFSLTCGFAQDDAPSRARYELNRGVAEYRDSHYPEAIEHFTIAVRLDPNLLIAHLYLATTYASAYVPGVETPENLRMATEAIDQYSEVLKRQPESVDSLKGIAYLYMQLKRFEEAHEFFVRALRIDPKDPELYYSVAVLDWTEVDRAIAQERAAMNLKPTQSFIFDNRCRDLRAKNIPAVEEGMTMLTKSISLRQNYDDAMVYLNLLYRSRAELECGNPEARRADEDRANDWSDLAMATRKKKTEAAQEQQKRKAETPTGHDFR